MKRGSTPTMVEWAILAWVAGKKITISQWGQSFFILRVASSLRKFTVLYTKSIFKKITKEWNGSE